jgi:hypothetical protein
MDRDDTVEVKSESTASDEEDLRYEENFDLEKIDPEVFESLPDEIKFELLTQYKQKLKSKKSQTYEEFPQVTICINHLRNFISGFLSIKILCLIEIGRFF